MVHVAVNLIAFNQIGKSNVNQPTVHVITSKLASLALYTLSNKVYTLVV